MRIPKNPRYIISHLVAAVTPGEYVALTTPEEMIAVLTQMIDEVELEEADNEP